MVLAHRVGHLDAPQFGPAVYRRDKSTPYLYLHGFSHGQNYEDYRISKKHDKQFHLAVVHDYCWATGHSFPGSPPDKDWKVHSKKLAKCGFDAAVFGDNHKGFLVGILPGNGFCPLVNPGTMICRTTDEREYKPFVGILLTSGKIVPYYLDTSRDKWNDKVEKESTEDNAEFLKELAKLGDSALDFADAVKRFMATNKTPISVRNLILSYLEGK